MSFIFNTLTFLVSGSVLLVVYVVILIFQKRTVELTLVNVSLVFFSAGTIHSGAELIYSTLLLLNDQLLEVFKIYRIYAGFCVLWISFVALEKQFFRVKAPVELKNY